jgi:5'-3' exonuclease
MNSSYKANRNRQKYKDHEKEIKELNKLLSLYGVYQYYASGIEADDIAGRLVEKNKGKNILLISNDNDWNFLLDDKVNIFKDNKIYTKEIIESLFEIDVKKKNLYKAVIGERKENITGIKSISHSLVNEMIKDCSSLEDIFNYCIVAIGMKSDKSKWYQKILDNFEKIKENYKLKTMITKGYKVQEIKRQKDIGKLLRELRKYSMNSLLQKIKKEEI